MKSLVQFVQESLITEALVLFKVNGRNHQLGAKIEDGLRNFLKFAKKSYSFNNKTDLEKFYKDFKEYAKLSISDLKEFAIVDAASLANLIINNHEKLQEAGWKLDKIKSFDESARQKEYKKWKASEDYVEGKAFSRKDAEDESEDELERTMVVYHCDDPGDESLVREYTFKGKVTKDNQRQISMIKMDWCYQTDNDYYDARPILLSNYLKKSDAELEARTAVDDIIGKFD